MSDARDLFWTAQQLARLAGDAASAVTNTNITSAFPTGSSSPAPLSDNLADERVDQLTLICAAMWELMKEKLNVTEDDLINRVAILDAKDGNADGKLTPTPVKCAACNRTIFPKHRRCLYCGAPVPVENLFKSV